MAGRYKRQPYQNNQKAPLPKTQPVVPATPIHQTELWHSFATLNEDIEFIRVILLWTGYYDNPTNIQINEIAKLAKSTNPVIERDMFRAMWFIITVFGQAEKKRVRIVSDKQSLKNGVFLPKERAKLYISKEDGIVIQFRHQNIVYHEHPLKGDVVIPNFIEYTKSQVKFYKFDNPDAVFYVNRALAVLYLLSHIDKSCYYFDHPRKIILQLHSIRSFLLNITPYVIDVQKTESHDLESLVIEEPLQFINHQLKFRGSTHSIIIDKKDMTENQKLFLFNHLSLGGIYPENDEKFTSLFTGIDYFSRYVRIRSLISHINKPMQMGSIPFYRDILLSQTNKNIRNNNIVIIMRQENVTGLVKYDTAPIQANDGSVIAYPIKIKHDREQIWIEPKRLLSSYIAVKDNRTESRTEMLRTLVLLLLCPDDLFEFLKKTSDHYLPTIQMNNRDYFEFLKSERIVIFS